MDNLDNNDRILLLKACNENCKKSTENLYIKYKPYIDKCYKSRWLQDIEDSYQELFLRIQEDKVDYKGKGNPEGFISNTLKNIHLEQHNNNKLKSKSLQDLENDGILPIDENTCNPLQNLKKNEQNQIILKAISELPPKSQEAIKLVYLEGLPAKQAAESICCEFRIFRNRLKYALKKLKVILYIY